MLGNYPHTYISTSKPSSTIKIIPQIKTKKTLKEVLLDIHKNISDNINELASLKNENSALRQQIKQYKTELEYYKEQTNSSLKLQKNE